MKVLMLLFKDIQYDARVKKEALTLANEGYHVTIACIQEYDKNIKLHPNINIVYIPVLTKRIKRQENVNYMKPPKSKIIKSNIKQPLLSITKIAKDILASLEYYHKIFQGGFHDVDVIHCHDLNTLHIGYLLYRKNHQSKLVYDSHELYNEMVGKRRIERKIGYKLERYLISKVNHIIVVNKFVLQEFKEMYGEIPITVLQNMPQVNNRQLIDESTNYFRKKYHLNDDDIILLYQGGLTPDRGIEECIASLLQLPKEFKMVLIGDGRLKESLIQLVAELQLDSRVFFHHQVDSESLLWYTKQADIGLVMYKNTCKNNYLSTPNKIFEYLNAGIPMVASNHPGKQYLIEKEKVGECIIETVEGIAEGILKVWSNYQYYKKNCVRVNGLYTWEKESKSLIVLYHSLLGCDNHE